MNSPEYECNLCGGKQFNDFRTRPKAQCATCGSLERTRVLRLMLDEAGVMARGMRVLHLAPELGIGRFLQKSVGDGYDARDFDPRGFPKELGVQKMDLVSECESLPSNTYDLVIHVHVLEHIPCNYTAVLFHLHRSLKATGRQMFGIPLSAGRYSSNFGTLPDAERVKQFGQADHVRRFGIRDLRNTIGMVFDLEPPNLPEKFGKDLLIRHRIPETAWTGFTSSTIFSLRKDKLRLLM